MYTDLRVIVYAYYKSSYVKSNLQRYLRDAHLIYSTKNLNILSYIDSLDIASNHDEVSRPNDRISLILGILVYDRFKCGVTNADSYRYITIYEPNIK